MAWAVGDFSGKHKTLILGCFLCNFSKTQRKIIAKHPETTALKDFDAAEKKLSYTVTTRLTNKKVKIK